VFYQIWQRPLLTVNGEHLISQVLQLCGADNVFADLRALTPTVTEEAVLRADPDAVVTGSIDPQGGDNLDGWRNLSALRATRNRHLLVVNPDRLHRQSTRVLQGAAELCDKLDAVRAGTANAR
jgi:iron complex transport system substrate-binding protein